MKSERVGQKGREKGESRRDGMGGKGRQVDKNW